MSSGAKERAKAGAAREIAPADAFPFVTVAMPCFNEAGYIEDCLRSVLAQDYPGDRFEILIADGRSTDRTLEIVRRLAREDRRIRVLDNPERIQAAGMNRAIRAARGDVVVRMDVHCEYASDYLRACARVLAETGAANVGGAQRARARTRFQRALCAALESPLGVGGARYRDAGTEGDADTVFLGAFRRRAFERAGLFDPGAITNEDAELNQRLLQLGERVYLSRDIRVHYYPRGSFRTLARQYFRYGVGRARTLLKHRTLPSIRPLVPFFMVVAGGAVVATPLLWPLAPALAGTHLAASGVEAVRVGRHLGPRGVGTVWAIFPVLHVSHGAGFAAGLWRYLRRPDWGEPEVLPARSEDDAPVAGAGRGA